MRKLRDSPTLAWLSTGIQQLRRQTSLRQMDRLNTIALRTSKAVIPSMMSPPPANGHSAIAAATLVKDFRSDEMEDRSVSMAPLDVTVHLAGAVPSGEVGALTNMRNHKSC